MAPDLRHIEAFLAVVRCGNFTRAAASLCVSQPALTVQVKQLEASLGIRLFDRNNRNVALTPLGRGLVAPFERVLLDLESIVDSAHDAASHRRGVVTVACLPSIAADMLPRAIARLGERHQGITVRVKDGVAARVIEWVKSGEADFGVSGIDRPDRELAVRPLMTDRLVAFVRRGHRLARARAVTLRDLVDDPLILTGKDSSVRELVDRTVEREGATVRISQEVTYMTTALGMAAAGLGVAILPEAAGVSATRAVRAVLISRPALTRQIGVVTGLSRSLSPAAEKLVEILHALVASEADKAPVEMRRRLRSSSRPRSSSRARAGPRSA